MVIGCLLHPGTAEKMVPWQLEGGASMQRGITKSDLIMQLVNVVEKK